MTAAGARLGMTQSAVSQTIAGLEASLGAQLFDRSVRPPRLTAAGGVLYDRARTLLDSARDLTQQVRGEGQQALPHLRVGMVDTVAAIIGPHLIQALRDAAVQWSVRAGLSPEHERALLGREVDIVIAGDVMQDTEGLVRHDILREPFFLALPASYTGKADSLADLCSAFDLVRHSGRSFFGRRFEGHLRRLGLEAPRRLEFDTADAVLAMVAAGVGWAVTTPLCFLQSLAHADGIRCLPLPGPALSRQLTLFAREHELGDLPPRIAGAAGEVLRRRCLPALAARAPWMAESLVIGQDRQ